MGGVTKKSNKKILSIVVIATLSIGIAVIGIHLLNIDFFWWEVNEEQKEQQIELGNRALFVQNMMFDTNSQYWPFDIVSMVLLDPRFDDIVFVETWQEGLNSDLPPNVIVAWPTPRTIGVLESMNIRAISLDFEFEQYEFSDPITMEDVISRWDEVLDLWINHLGRGSHNYAYINFEEAQQAYFDEISAARRERGIPEPVRWRPLWE